MKIVHAVTSIEAEASGPSYSVPRLCRALAGVGHEVDLLSLGAEPSSTPAEYRDIRLGRDLAQVSVLNRLGFSGSMRHTLMRSDAAVFHAHGLWMMPNVYPAWAARKLGRPLVLSPRGMLGEDALRFSRTKKRLFWALAQGAAIRGVTCFHATAESEYEDIRAFGLKQPVAIIPNGVDLPQKPPAPSHSGAPFVLSLGRIHPKKALDRLIRAWASVSPDFPQWQLKIVGPDELGFAKELARLARELKLATVEISGPVYGGEKTALLSRAELFALPTLHENFGMTVAESLAVGTPVISTKGAPWSGLETHDCGWWIDHGAEPMAAALRRAMSLTSDQRRKMGVQGTAWMQTDFGWEGIGQKMAEVYRWLTVGDARPAWVREG